METLTHMLQVLIVGGLGVALAFLIADFAERLRLRVYEARQQVAPDSNFRRYVTVAFAAFFVAWSAVAYL